jgi:hypothetical protein
MWSRRKRERRSPREDCLIEFTVPGRGPIVGDAEEVVKLRSAAATVGGSSFELSDIDGDLAIALSMPGTTPIDAVQVIKRFCQLAGLPPPA